ncbi:MAG: radical SAM protein [Defluviitaleaceae bacterium]|nr:radical SAM protein [Defluviitaleaceae bacterium]
MMNKLRLSGFSHESFVDGPGIRVVVFVQGCENACEHCHNPQSWDANGGEEYTASEVVKRIKDATGASRHRNHLVAGLALAPNDARKKGSKPPRKEFQGVTFSGGEPFLQAAALVKIATAVKGMGLDITIYTGYTYEELAANPDEDIQSLLALADYLIDGPYVHKLRDIGLKFRGSSNQRVIDMNETRKAGRVVEFM